MDDFDKLKKLIDSGELTSSQIAIGLLTLIENLYSESETKIEDVVNSITSQPLPEKGEKGDKGENGKDGRDGVDGKNGRDGIDGRNGVDGADGKDGENGKDGSSDTAEQVRDKLESLEGDDRLDAKAIKNLPKAIEKNFPYGTNIADITAGANLTRTITGGNYYDFAVNPGLTGIDYIDFDLTANPSHSEGRIHWNDDDKTIDIDTEVTGTSIQVGQEQVFRATNKTGDTLTNGTVVYVNGSQGNRPTIAKADASTQATSEGTIGIVTNDIADNATGYVTEFGLVRDIDTSAFNEGDIIYLSTTAGELTNVEPVSPNHSVRVGVVTNSNVNEGVVLVNVDPGDSMEKLHDVLLTSLANKDILQYNSSTMLWENTGNPLRNIETITASSDTLDANNYTVLCDASSNAITINLPAAASHNGREYNVKKIDSTANTITVDGNGSETIDGSTTAIITEQYASITVQSDGSNWHIV